MGKKRNDRSILVEVSPTASLIFDGTPMETHTQRKNKKRRRRRDSEVPTDECAPISPSDIEDDDAGPSWTEPVIIASEEDHNQGVKKKRKVRNKEKEPEPEVEFSVTETVVIAEKDKKRKKMDRNQDKQLIIKRKRQLQGGEEERSVDVVIVEDADSESFTDEERKKADRHQVESTAESDMSVVMETGDTSRRKKRPRPGVATVTAEDNMTADHMEETFGRNCDTAESETGEVQREKKKKKKKDDEVILEPPTIPPTATTEQVVVTGAGGEKIQRKRAITRCGGGVAEEERECREKRRGGGGGGGVVKVSRGSLKERPVITDNPLYDRDVKELKEFIPDIMSKCPQVIYKMVKYDLERFRKFKRQGIALRKGRFSAEENAKITENVNNFLALTSIASATHLFYPANYPDDSQEIKRLRALHHFHTSLAEDIARPWHQVYVRARKMYDEYNYKGRFSEEELHSLAKHQKLHGNDWKAISKKMDRSNYALEKRFTAMGCMNGPWKQEEVVRLKLAVRGLLERIVEPGQPGPRGPTIRRENLYTSLAWSDIAAQVQTRHWIQCRLKWMGILKTKMAAGRAPPIARGVKGLQAKIDLINTLHALQVDDSAEIDWEEVAGTIGNVTPMYVQKHFYRLKVSRVPLATRLTYAEIIDFLHEKVVPKLVEKLQKARQAGATPLPLKEGSQEVFLLNDILPTQENEEEFSEVDNTHINQSDYGLTEDQDI